MHDQHGYREYVLDKAIASGKFPASRREHYRRLYDRDPEGTENLIARLAPGLPPGDAPRSQPEDGLPSSWFRELDGQPVAASPASAPAPARPTPPAAKGEGLPVEWFPELLEEPDPERCVIFEGT